MLTLGIETSCDETSVAVVDYNKNSCRILSNRVYTQSGHSQFGGVVPEIASREHLMKVESILEDALHEAAVEQKDLELIAVTVGPGLLGALLVGAAFAQGLGYSLGIPVAGVNHLFAHVYASSLQYPEIEPPLPALLVSGGHTQLLLVEKHWQIKVIAETRDDAVGELIDKTGKIMGLPYPAGKAFSLLADKGNKEAIAFPRGMIKTKELAFSFSGLKTAIARHVQEQGPEMPDSVKVDICASAQEAWVDSLGRKTMSFLKTESYSDLILCGGGIF